MTRRPSRLTPDGTAYLDLRALARERGRPTDELLQLYALEGFLDRLSGSLHATDLVLKGGVLLAAFAARRPTRDIDVAIADPDADPSFVSRMVDEVLAIGRDDGLTFDRTVTTVEASSIDGIRQGTRARVSGSLSTARFRFHVDISAGEPIWPPPRRLEVPRLLGGPPLSLLGYPLELVLAEKIVTALQRGTANTRWRDFVDIATLAEREVSDVDLVESIRRVATHRHTPIGRLADVLDGFGELAQDHWSAWRRRQHLTDTPESFADLLDAVVAFSDRHLGRLLD